MLITKKILIMARLQNFTTLMDFCLCFLWNSKKTLNFWIIICVLYIQTKTRFHISSSLKIYKRAYYSLENICLKFTGTYKSYKANRNKSHSTGPSLNLGMMINIANYSS